MNNIPFINIVRVITIFGVILAHLPIPENLCKFISIFRMPLFFFVSGYLVSFKDIAFKDFLQKKLKTLILPYFWFAVITFLFWYFAGRKYGDDALNPGDPVKFLLGIFLAIPSKEFLGFNIPIWFLPCLFFTESLFFMIRKHFANREFLLIIPLFVIGLFIKEITPIPLPWGLNISICALLFFYTGYLLRKQGFGEFHINKLSYIKRVAVSIMFLLLTILFSYLNEERVEFYLLEFGNYVLFFSGAFSGIVFVVFLSSCISNNRLWTFYGRNTIIILGFHFLSFTFIKGIQFFVLKIPLDIINGSVIYNIIYALLSFVILAPVIIFINKYCPFLLGRKKAIG